MRQLLAIAANTFRESIRDRILYSLVFFAVLMLFTSLALEEITVGDQDKVVRSVALGAIRLFGSVVSVFLGIGLVYKEIERKTIYTIASKPIPRWLFVVGKYAGLMAVIAVLIGLMGAIYLVLITVQQGFPGGGVFLSWGMLYVELALLTAWAILFSSYSSPITASSFSLAVFVIGHLADDLWLFGQQAESETVRKLSEVIYWVLPNFSVFNIHGLVIHDLPIPAGQVLGALGYGVGYTAAVLAVACMVFNTRDFK
ncbi:MAG: ABC transporter permease [Alphaproteobacteria bacterium]|nr:ABC transporter permease [Alphaproteobacteria bacterium]